MIRTRPRPRIRPILEPLEGRNLPSGSFSTAPVLPQIDVTMKAHLRAVVAAGQQGGMREEVFAKAGDSITANPSFLIPLGAATYDPGNPAVAGAFTTLAGTVNFFRATEVDATSTSFNRASAAAFPGWVSAQVNATLSTEIDAIHPGIVLIMIGTNDAATGTDLTAYRAILESITNTALSRGVIPVLSTVPDHEPSDSVFEPRNIQINQIIADVADKYNVPLWNYWRALQTLPNHGLDSGGVHPSADPRGAGYFDAAGLAYGFNVRNLTAVQVLDKIKDIVLDNGAADPTLTGDPVTTWEPLPVSSHVTVTGADAGNHPYVTVFDADNGVLLSRFLAFDLGFTGGVRVATADVNGDGFTDVIVGAGPGGGPAVKVFSGRDGSVLTAFFAYGDDFTGGVFVAAGDVNGDGVPDVVTGAGAGGGPHVKVFDVRTGQAVLGFFAYDQKFTGGVAVAVGNVLGQGPGHAQIVTGTGPSGGPNVKVFDGQTGQELRSFFAYDEKFRGGLTVAVGDMNGDGRPDIITGAGSGGGPAVEVFDALTTTLINGFFAFDESFLGGVRVAVVNEGGSPASPPILVVVPGPTGGPFLRRFRGVSGTAIPDDVTVLDPTFLGGLFVAGT
jgi:lysophospholipase L1-like esterase